MKVVLTFCCLMLVIGLPALEAAAPTTSAAPPAQILVFATVQTFAGNTGRSNFDDACWTEANNQQGSVFRALMTDRGFGSVKDVLPDGEIVNALGQRVAADKNALFPESESGYSLEAPILDVNGSAVSGNAWTGADVISGSNDVGAIDCNSWNDAGGAGFYGDTSSTSSTWFVTGQNSNCGSSSYRVYCYDTTVVQGKEDTLMFVSSSTITGGSLNSMDDLCWNEGSGFQSGQRYKAFVIHPNLEYNLYNVIGGGRILNSAGQVIAEHKDQLFGRCSEATLQNPILDLSGNLVDSYVWAGSDNPGTGATEHCGAFTSTNAFGLAGNASSMTADYWLNGVQQSCSTSLPVYCIQLHDKNCPAGRWAHELDNCLLRAGRGGSCSSQCNNVGLTCLLEKTRSFGRDSAGVNHLQFCSTIWSIFNRQSLGSVTLLSNSGAAGCSQGALSGQTAILIPGNAVTTCEASNSDYYRFCACGEEGDDLVDTPPTEPICPTEAPTTTPTPTTTPAPTTAPPSANFLVLLLNGFQEIGWEGAIPVAYTDENNARHFTFTWTAAEIEIQTPNGDYLRCFRKGCLFGQTSQKFTIDAFSQQGEVAYVLLQRGQQYVSYSNGKFALNNEKAGASLFQIPAQA